MRVCRRDDVRSSPGRDRVLGRRGRKGWARSLGESRCLCEFQRGA